MACNYKKTQFLKIIILPFVILHKSESISPAILYHAGCDAPITFIQ